MAMKKKKLLNEVQRRIKQMEEVYSKHLQELF